MWMWTSLIGAGSHVWGGCKAISRRFLCIFGSGLGKNLHLNCTNRRTANSALCGIPHWLTEDGVFKLCTVKTTVVNEYSQKACLVCPCSLFLGQIKPWFFAWIWTWKGGKDTQDPSAICAAVACHANWIPGNFNPIHTSVNPAERVIHCTRILFLVAQCSSVPTRFIKVNPAFTTSRYHRRNCSPWSISTCRNSSSG